MRTRAGRRIGADTSRGASGVLGERDTGEVNVVRMRVLGAALDANVRHADRHRERIDAVERVDQLSEIHVFELQLHAVFGETVAELAIGAGRDRANLLAADALGHRRFDDREQREILAQRDRVLLGVGKVGLELSVSAGETANLGEIMLPLRNLVLEPRAKIDDRHVDKIVDEKNSEQAAGDLHQDAFARFEFLVTAASLSDVRIDAGGGLLEQRAEQVHHSRAQIVDPLSKHGSYSSRSFPGSSRSVAGVASLKFASMRKSTLLGSEPALACATSIEPKKPLWSSARLA